MTFLRPLLEGVIDYAGLFPPAALPMQAAVHSYAAYRSGPHAWMLGRYIVPAGRISECAEAAAMLPGELQAGPPWKLSAIMEADLASGVHAVLAFNDAHRTFPGMQIDTVEFRAQQRADIVAVKTLLPPGIAGYAELPLAGDLRPLIEELARTGLRAKVRTGGTTPNAFPGAAALARFVLQCVSAGVVFKATAGLHHPLHGRYRLTYEPDSPYGTMFGFLNVLCATAMASEGAREDEVRRMLEMGDMRAVRSAGNALLIGDRRFDAGALAGVRTRLTAFGSCSFEEPVNDLLHMGLL